MRRLGSRAVRALIYSDTAGPFNVHEPSLPTNATRSSIVAATGIVPAHNRAETLPHELDSIQEQTMPGMIALGP